MPSKISETCRRRLYTMKVLLLKDVKALGKVGEIVKVSDGYARNYIIPKELGVEATASVVKQVEDKKRAESVRIKEQIDSARKKVEELKKNVLVIPAHAGEGTKLYGAITSSDVAKKISEYLGEEFDRKNIEMDPIKDLGVYEIKAKFGNGVSGKIKIKVEREEQGKS